jgi:hypothetical protein
MQSPNASTQEELESALKQIQVLESAISKQEAFESLAEMSRKLASEDAFVPESKHQSQWKGDDRRQSRCVIV